MRSIITATLIALISSPALGAESAAAPESDGEIVVTGSIYRGDASSAMRRPRQIAMLLHGWIGLGLALFLTVVGLTGATIAWNDELERVFAPAMFVLPPDASRQTPLDPFALREAALRAMPGYAADGVDFTRDPDAPALFYIEPRPGGPAPPEDQIALDPSTGHVLAARRLGDLSEGATNLMPFIYELHDQLALGETGALILGIVALFWTIDCFIGAWLTFPVTGRARWLPRWGKAWRVRLPTAPFKLTFDLHRAGGLWLWMMLFVLAWSSVGFNLGVVYQPVMTTVLGTAPEPASPPARDAGVLPRLGWRDAHRVAQSAMAAAARREGFTVLSERLMFYDPSSHIYSYRVRSSRDVGRLGNTQIGIDGDTGQASHLVLPTGRYAGDTVTSWIGDLHTANVFGRPMQVLLTVVGLGIAMLSVTGVMIWLRKHRARQRRRIRAFDVLTRLRRSGRPQPAAAPR